MDHNEHLLDHEARLRAIEALIRKNSDSTLELSTELETAKEGIENEHLPALEPES